MDESGLIVCETPMDGVQPICRVLIVDDHVHVRKVIMRLLDERGYLVSSASDGRQAMEQIKASTPDVVMLDTALPDISGLDILDEIRRQKLDVAVILMATYRADKIAGDALRHGADDYLHLPVELNDLDVVFARTIQRLTLRRQNVILRRQLEEKGQLLEKELTRAAQVQSRMIPREMPQLDGFELAARFIPARQVAGDFYDSANAGARHFNAHVRRCDGQGHVFRAGDGDGARGITRRCPRESARGCDALCLCRARQ